MKSFNSENDDMFYPLHSSQAEIYFDQLRCCDSAEYNVGGYFKIHGELDIEKFTQAIQSVVRHTDAFRIRLVENDQGVEQSFQACLTDNPEVELLDFRKDLAPTETALDWISADFSIAYNLFESKPLYNNRLILITDTEVWWYNKAHHILTDGLGYTKYISLVSKAYNSLIQDGSLEWLEKLPSYQQSIEKSQTYLKSNQYHKDAAYWLSKYQ
jgi:NRPS condensation-like uncharacterized protein